LVPASTRWVSGRLFAGDTVVVTAAGGGAGLHTLQLGRALGLNEIAMTSSERKEATLRAAGATHVLVSGEKGFHGRVRELTEGAEADAVIEIVGTPTFASSVRWLTAGGRLVVVGNMRPGTVDFNPLLAILKIESSEEYFAEFSMPPTGRDAKPVASHRPSAPTALRPVKRVVERGSNRFL
jgi:NADPH:quinone reductase-like Zn-dependent oxidoreductase